jgi:uncharacterized protein
MGVIRNLPDDQIEALFRSAIVYRIACSHPDHRRPYLVPISCAYDGSSLFGHTGPGTKLTHMRANPLVAIEVDRATASDRWESAVAEGAFNELAGEDRKMALDLIYPEQTTRPDLGEMTVVFRIALSNKTGRIERPTDADFDKENE